MSKTEREQVQSSFVLYDGECSACERMAVEAIERLGGGMVPLELQSEHAQQLLSRAGMEGLRRPAIVTDRGPDVSIYTGMSMRMKVVAEVGPRRALELRRALGALPQRGATADGTSRRRFVTGLAASGIGSLAILGAGAGTASARSQRVRLTRAEVSGLGNLPVVEEAEILFGAPMLSAATRFDGGWFLPFRSVAGAAATYMLISAKNTSIAALFRLFPVGDLTLLATYLPNGACVGAFRSDGYFAGLVGGPQGVPAIDDPSKFVDLDFTDVSQTQGLLQAFVPSTKANLKSYAKEQLASPQKVCTAGPTNFSIECLILCTGVYALKLSSLTLDCAKCAQEHKAIDCELCLYDAESHPEDFAAFILCLIECSLLIFPIEVGPIGTCPD